MYKSLFLIDLSKVYHGTCPTILKSLLYCFIQKSGPTSVTIDTNI